MKSVEISTSIKEKYGDIKVAYLFVENVSVLSTPPRQKKIARKVEDDLRQKLKLEALYSEKSVQDWVRLSNKMGVSDVEFYPAHIGLLRQILSGRTMPKINNIVDAANIISAKYNCPVGVFDADKIEEFILIRCAKEGEAYAPILSTDKVNVPNGEIVYTDAHGVFSRYCKDADRTKITETTRAVFCVIDGTNDTPIDNMIKARDELREILNEVGGSNLVFTYGLTD